MKIKKKILSLLLAIAMILGMVPMMAVPAYAAEATKIKIWNGTEMQTYTLGTDTLPAGLEWNSAENRLELDGYNGGRIEHETSGDQLTFYVLSDSTIDGGEETALNYSNPTIDGATGKTLTLTGTKNGVFYINSNCDIKNITVKVIQYGIEKPNGWTTGSSGNIHVRENGRLEITLNKEAANTYPAQGCSNLSLYDNGSASISVTANVYATGAFGVSRLSLNGTGNCTIAVTNSGSGDTMACEAEPTLPNPSPYNVTGAWNGPSVSYTLASSFNVNVVKGTTSTPTPPAGDTVTITADEPAPGEVFDGWTGTDGVTFADASSPTTTFVMPAKDVTVTANYKNIYSITVYSGSADKTTAAAGEYVTVTANAPATGKVFDRWTSSDIPTFNWLANPLNFTMPSNPVTITATYKTDPNIVTELNNIKAYISKPANPVEDPPLNPSFAKGIREYTLNIGTDYTNVYFSLDPMVDGQAVTATVDGASLTVGKSSGFITDSHTFSKDATVFVFTVTSKNGSATGTYKVTINRTDATVTSIAVNSTTHKTAYKVGDTLDVSNLTIEATMSDSTKQTINVTSGMVTGFDSSAVDANQTLTITYGGKTTTYDISIDKADGPLAPTAPTLESKTYNSITVTANSAHEFSKDGTTWQTSNVFGGLTGNTSYNIYARIAETATHNASIASPALNVTTDTASIGVLTGTVNITGTWKYGETLTAEVTGSNNTGTLSYQWKRGSTAIGTNSNTYVAIVDDIGYIITCEVSSSVQTGTISGNTSGNIGKADGPAAPTGIAGVKPTTLGGSDGKITGTTSLMEYDDNSSFTSPTACTDTETTGLSADTYYIRVKATTTHEAGAYAMITVPEGSAATVTSIAVNSTTHKIAYKVGDTLDVSNLTIEATMSDSSTQTINVNSGMVTGFDSSAVDVSQTLTITYDGQTTTYDISIAKADGPLAPTGLNGVKPTTLGGSDGKITGTTALMEYDDNSGFTSSTDCTDTETTGLSAGTYYVRVKATATHEAGTYATVTVPEGSAATYTVTISGDVSGATGSGSYTAGTTINIYAGSRSGYTFTGWTSSDVTITNASNKNASFTMPAKNVTVTANWSYNGSSSSSSGGSSSSTNATLSNSKAEFEKKEGKDMTVNLRSGSYNLRSIKNGSYTLREGKDYTISGRIVTIKASYLDSLKEGKHSLTFDMNGGTDPVLTVTITDTTETDIKEEKPSVEESVEFEDVKTGDWFYDAVNYVYNAGLMRGNSDTTFNPYTDTTRGMIVTILHRLEGSPKADIDNGFTDVGAYKYYTDAVTWASENKIVSGYGNDIFGAENSITREQLAVILMNYAKYKGYDVSMRTDLSEFADGEHISTWAKDPMSWANAEGLIQGSQNQLMPKGNAQRSQVAAILQRFLETIAK